MRGLATSCAAALVIASTIALADSGSDAVRLDYQVDARCPGADAFVGEVHARSPRVRFAEGASRTLVVRVESHGGKLAGRVELGSTQRAVTGATCEEVLSALGLVTALALDPLGVTTTENGADAGAGTNANATTSTDAGASTESRADASTETEAADAGTDAAPAWSLGAGADLEVVFGVAPDPIFAVPVFFEATRAIDKHWAVGGALRFVHAGDTAVTSGVGADFDWTAGALDLCGVFRAGPFRLNACERTTIGAIEANGVGVLPSRSAVRPWVDLGIAATLRLRLVGPLFVEATGHVGFALVQDRYFLQPDQTVFQVPLVVGQVGGGVGFEIW